MEKSKEPPERREANISGETSEDISVSMTVTRSLASRVLTGPAEEQTTDSVTIDTSQEPGSIVMSAKGDSIKKRAREDSGEGRETDPSPKQPKKSKPNTDATQTAASNDATKQEDESDFVPEEAGPNHPAQDGSRELPADAMFHPKHNHADGSIIILMQDTLFRLHRSSLVHKSIYFSERFGTLGEMDANSRSPPIVNVDACAVSFAILLDALDDFGILVEKPSFATISAILRSSTELHFPTLCKWAIKAFEKLWPLTLHSVTNRRRPLRECLKAIHLAREYKVPNVLKRAMYEVMRSEQFSEAAILCEDMYSLDQNKVILTLYLDEEDVVRFINARDTLSKAWLDTILPCPTFNKCISRSPCITPKKWNDVHSLQLMSEGMFDPLVGLALLGDVPTSWSIPLQLVGPRLKDSKGKTIVAGPNIKSSAKDVHPNVIRTRSICWRKSKVCRACADEMEKMCEDARERIWAELEGEKYLDLSSGSGEPEGDDDNDDNDDNESDGDDDDDDVDDDDDDGQD